MVRSVFGLALTALAQGCLAPAFYADLHGHEAAAPAAFKKPGGNVLTGKACWNSYVGIVALGDASVDAALKAAGVDPLKPVKNLIVDHSLWTIGPFYQEYCTVITVSSPDSESTDMSPPENLPDDKGLPLEDTSIPAEEQAIPVEKKESPAKSKPAKKKKAKKRAKKAKKPAKKAKKPAKKKKKSAKKAESAG